MSRQSSEILEFEQRGNFGFWQGNFDEEFSPNQFVVDSLFAYSNNYGRCIAVHNESIFIYSFPKMENHLVGGQLNLFEDEDACNDLLCVELNFQHAVQFVHLSKSEKLFCVALKGTNDVLVFDIGTLSDKVVG